MENKALAFLIPTLLAAGTVCVAEVYSKDGNKLDLCDKVNDLHYFSDNSVRDGDQSYARLGFKGEAQINGQLTDYGQWEYNIQVNSTESSTNQSQTRLALAGLRSVGYDSSDYRCNHGVVYDIESWTDMPPEFGGDSYTNANNFITGRANDVMTYRNTDFFGLVSGLNFTMQYQGNNEGASNGQESTNNGRDVRHEDGDGWGLPTTYDLGMDSSAGTTYTSSDHTNDQVSRTAAGGDKAGAWTVGLKYGANNTCLATTYSEIRNMIPFGDSDYAVANKTQSSEVTTQYQFDLGLCLAVSFLMSKGRDLHAAGGTDNPADANDKDLVRYADVGVIYYFNKNMPTYVDYKINLLDEDDSFCATNGTSTDDIAALSLAYQF